MANPDERYRRWLDEEARARRLDRRRRAARRRCDEALSASSGGDGPREEVVARLEELERAVEASLAFYLGHTANDQSFLRAAFGPSRARELAARLAERKVALMKELDGVREMRRRLAAKPSARRSRR